MAIKTRNDSGARTDIHRPQVFEPTDYECRAPWDTQPPVPDVRSFRDAEGFARAMKERERYMDAMRAEFGGRVPHNCDHCGAWFRYCWSVDHKPSGAVVAMGEQCVDNRLDLPGHDAFRMRFLQDAASKAAAENKRVEELGAWITANADVAAWLMSRTEDRFAFIREMALQAARKPLSENQTAAVRRLMAKAAERDAQRAAERAAQPVPMSPAPVGRVKVVGTIVKVKEQLGPIEFGRPAWITYKMIVALEDGNRVWTTVPREVLNGVGYGLAELPGTKIELTATFERSDRDEHFSFGKRPSTRVLAPSPATIAANNKIG